MEQLATMLKQHRSVDGISSFEHLKNLFYKIIYEPNEHSKRLEFLETLSEFEKKNSFKYKIPKSDKEVNNIPIVTGEHQFWIEKCQKLIQDLQKIPQNLQILFPNFVYDSQLLEMTGISFGEEENQRIQQSLRKLAYDTSAKQLRFWGKILARKNDYFIAEGITSNENADKMPKDAEPKGEGANLYTYWVTHNVLDEWYELPLVTPQQIKLAREIKYLFTGNLDAQIRSYPNFQGKEKHLLKAQIVRISYATVLAPKGLYKIVDEKPQEVEFEEIEGGFKLPEHSELKNLSTWVHMQPCLLNLGRTTHYVDPILPEEQKTAIQDELNEKDPVVDRLKGIEEEKSPFPPQAEGEEEGLNWQVREVGDQQIYNLIAKEEGSTGCYGAVVLKNLTWPGSYLIANSRQGWCNIYVGYGLKINQKSFIPVQPQDQFEEQDDVEEYPEPYPTKPPPPPEINPEEKKEGEDNPPPEEEQ